MKSITMNKLCWRITEVNTSQKAGGFKPRENIKWGGIAAKILDDIKDYDEPVYALTEEAERTQNNVDLLDDERNDEMRRINTEMREWDESLGQDVVTIVLDDGEYTFIKGIWEDLPFNGNRVTRARIKAITDALDPKSETNPNGSYDVKIVDGQVVPASEADKLAASPNGKSVGKVRQLVGAKRR